MSFDIARPQRTLYVPPGAGESRWVFGDRYTVKAAAAETGGALGLMEALVPPGGGPPAHIHHREDEAFYLIEGKVEIMDAGERTEVGAGSFVFVPRGSVHAFRNIGDQPCRMLIMFLPGGNEQFFLDIGSPAGNGEPPPPESQYAADLARAERIVADYGAEYV